MKVTESENWINCYTNFTKKYWKRLFLYLYMPSYTLASRYIQTRYIIETTDYTYLISYFLFLLFKIARDIIMLIHENKVKIKPKTQLLKRAWNISHTVVGRHVQTVEKKPWVVQHLKWNHMSCIFNKQKENVPSFSEEYRKYLYALVHTSSVNVLCGNFILHYREK